MAYLLAGPLVALIGIGAIFFVLRRKSEDKRSMYSARRSQIEHKVRAARQRTLAPHGRGEKPSEQPADQPAPMAASPFDQTQVQPRVTYQATAYQAPPAAPAPAPPSAVPAPEPPPWEQPSTPPVPPAAPAAPPSSFDFPPSQPEPYTPAPVEPFRPAAEPTPMPAPSEPSWTPAPRPAEPLPPAETMAPAASTVAPAATSTSAGGWSIVSTAKDSAVSAEPTSRKKDKGGSPTGDWTLASGVAPGAEPDEPAARASSGTIRAVALYAIFVVGLIMVLIGVLAMLANSHVT